MGGQLALCGCNPFILPSDWIFFIFYCICQSRANEKSPCIFRPEELSSSCWPIGLNYFILDWRCKIYKGQSEIIAFLFWIVAKQDRLEYWCPNWALTDMIEGRFYFVGPLEMPVWKWFIQDYLYTRSSCLYSNSGEADMWPS